MKVKGSAKRVVQVRIPVAQYEVLAQYAVERDTTISDILRPQIRQTVALISAGVAVPVAA